MIRTEAVKTKNKNPCLGREVSSLGETEFGGAWQQKSHQQYSVKIIKKRRSLTMEKTIKMTMLTIVSLMSIAFFSACDKEMMNEPLEVQSEITEVSKGTGELLAWERARTDYSYLEDKVGEANQYLTHNKLSLEDLKQLHEIGNLIFGEYRTTLAKNWGTRTAESIENIMDKELFHSEYARRDFYSTLSLSYLKNKDIENAPNIRILTNHIGERGNYIFITARVYAPIADRDWKYIILQLKRSGQSKYGWLIYYHDMEVPGLTDRGTSGPWTVEINENDDFSSEAWLNAQEVVNDEEWESRFTREKTPTQSSINIIPLSSTRRTPKYNRQAAASYAYRHAKNYNSNYFSWKPWGVDCANFASQCLVAGGLPQNEEWKYFYNAKDKMSSGTPAWRGARELYNYLLADAARATKVPIQYLIDTYQGKAGAWCALRWGDLIFVNRNKSGSKKHAIVISHGYQDTNSHYNGTPKYKISAHTTDWEDEDFEIVDIEYYRKNAVGVKIEY